MNPLDLPSLSRNPFRKYDDQLERLPIHSEIKVRLRQQAQEMDMSLNEFIRTVLECRALGVENVAMLHAQRVRAIGGTEGGFEGAGTGGEDHHFSYGGR